MAKSKFSKKQIAGTLLLSSAAISAVASGTASANKFKDFLGNGLRKAGELVKIAVGDKIGNKLDGHEQIVGTVVGTVTVGLLFALTYVTYRAIRAGFDYYSDNKENNENKKKIEIDNNKKIEDNEKNEKKILDEKGKILDKEDNAQIEKGNIINEEKSDSQSISIQKKETNQVIDNNETEKNKIKNNNGNSNTGTTSDNNNS